MPYSRGYFLPSQRGWFELGTDGCGESCVGIADEVVRWNKASEQIFIHGIINAATASIGPGMPVTIEGDQGAVQEVLM